MNHNVQPEPGFMQQQLQRLLRQLAWRECLSPDHGAYLPLTHASSPDEPAGHLRLWLPDGRSPIDRMVYLRLLAGPTETQLLFVFGRDHLSMPHLHLQLVEFPPEGCVYNADLLPRLDPVYYPEWFAHVYTRLRRPYRQATSEPQNSCAQAPANPALAVYMSPWGLASGRTTNTELERVRPQLEEYVSHYIQLAKTSDWDAPHGVNLRDRDARHLQLFFDDELDPRAWHGVYRIVGESRGKLIKSLFQKPQHADNPV